MTSADSPIVLVVDDDTRMRAAMQRRPKVTKKSGHNTGTIGFLACILSLFC
jgi:hypothetical protein